MSFSIRLRVYYEDTDAGGIVYYANYLRFMERARTEWLRHLGVQQEALRNDGVLFVVTEANARYKKPARLDDELMVSVSVERLSRTRLVFKQQVLRCCAGVSSQKGSLDQHEELLVEGRVSVACMAPSGRPCAIPSRVKALIEAAESFSEN